MTAALVLVRIALAAVLAVAGLAKLADRAGARTAAAELGFRASVARVAVAGLPGLEVALAAGLLGTATARWCALASVALLFLFSGLLGRSLRRGERLACHCFGQLSDAAAGTRTLVRNGVLIAAAMLVVVAPGVSDWSIAAWLGGLTAADRIAFWFGLSLALVVVAAIWTVRELLSSYGRVLLRLEGLEAARPGARGLPVGTPAPQFAVAAHRGGELTLSGLLAMGLPVVIVFSDADCGPCVEAVPLLGQAERAWAGRLTVVLLSRGSTPRSEAAWDEHGLGRVGVVPDHDLALGYGAAGTPAAVLLTREGRIDTALAAGIGQVRELLQAPVGRVEGAIGSAPPRDAEPLLVATSSGPLSSRDLVR